MSSMLDCRSSTSAFVHETRTSRISDGDKEKSGLVSRNVTIGNHRTSIRLEPDMWSALRDICRREHVTIHDIATVVSVRKAANSSLTAAMRVFVMAYYRMAATEEGHNGAGHGPGGACMRSLLDRKTEEQDNTTACMARFRDSSHSRFSRA